MHHIAFAKNLIQHFKKSNESKVIQCLCESRLPDIQILLVVMMMMMMTTSAQCSGAQHLVHQAEGEL